MSYKGNKKAGGGKDNRHFAEKDPAEAVTTKGRRLCDLEKEEEERKCQEQRMRREIRSLFETQPSAVAYKRFILVSFSTHCVTSNGEVVPAEGSIISMSLKNGIRTEWHSFLNPGEIPFGYRAECLRIARKTHNIPLDTEELYTKSDADICRDIMQIIADICYVPDQPQPVFCMDEERSTVRSVLELLFKRAGQKYPNPPVYSLEEMMLAMDHAVKKLKFIKDQKKGLKVEPPVSSDHVLNLEVMKNVLLSGDFDASATVCPFHDEADNFEHCTLGKVRRRAYIIMDRLCDGEPFTDDDKIDMQPGFHFPAKGGQPNLQGHFVKMDENENVSLRKTALEKRENIPHQNLLGTKLPKCGSMGGMTELPSNVDPGELIRNRMKELTMGAGGSVGGRDTTFSETTGGEDSTFLDDTDDGASFSLGLNSTQTFISDTTFATMRQEDHNITSFSDFQNF